MTIIRLTDAGQSHTMTVTACAAVPGQYGEQVRFDGDGDTLYLPYDSARRQLVRSDLVAATDPDFETVVGQRLTFSRSENPKKGAKPFWDIAWEGGASAPRAPKAVVPARPTPPAARGDLPGDPDDGFDALLDDAPPAEDLPAAATPRKPTEAEALAERHRASRRAIVEATKALWRDCAAFQQSVCTSAGDGAEAPVERVPFDAASINAMAAYIGIQWEKAGVQVR